VVDPKPSVSGAAAPATRLNGPVYGHRYVLIAKRNFGWEDAVGKAGKNAASNMYAESIRTRKAICGNSRRSGRTERTAGEWKGGLQDREALMVPGKRTSKGGDTNRRKGTNARMWKVAMATTETFPSPFCVEKQENQGDGVFIGLSLATTGQRARSMKSWGQDGKTMLRMAVNLMIRLERDEKSTWGGLPNQGGKQNKSRRLADRPIISDVSAERGSGPTRRKRLQGIGKVDGWSSSESRKSRGWAVIQVVIETSTR